MKINEWKADARKKRPFLEELKNNIQDAGRRPANLFDWLFFWACAALSLLMLVVR